MDYESSELESGIALRKLFVMALMAAIQILQLRQARSGNTEQKTSLVFSDKQVACLNDLLPRFEGKTQKHQNPISRDNLGVGGMDNCPVRRLEKLHQPASSGSHYPA